MAFMISPMKRTISLAVAVLVAASLLAALPGTAIAQSRIIVREGGNKLVEIPASGGRPQVLARAPKGALVGSSASANGQTVTFSSRTSEMTPEGPAMTDKVWVKSAGQRPRLLRTFVSIGIERQSNPVNAISLSPDGRRLLITKRGGTVLAMGTDGRGTRPVSVPGFRFAIGPHPNGSGAKFTPDGRRIIAAFERTTSEGPDCGVGIVPVNGGNVRFIRTGRQFAGVSRFTAPALSPDGRTVVFLEHLRDYERLLVMRLDSGGAHAIAGSLRDNWKLANPTFSPSGRALAFEATRVFGGGTIVGRSPSRIYTVRRSGAHLHLAQTEKADTHFRNPTWVH
jgi:dipeptidyl aminopeptidase/acylaminoacyl peptidase